MKWSPYVMVRICLFFIAGILMAIYQPLFISDEAAVSLVITSTLVYILIYFFIQAISIRKLALGFFGLATILLAGYLMVLQKTESRKPTHFLHSTETIQFYEAQAATSLDEKANSWKILLEVKRIKTNSGWREVIGKVQLYISKESTLPKINYGDILLVKGSPEEIRPPANPAEFDFKRFLGFKNIYHQQFIRAENLKIIGNAEHKNFIYYSYQVRAWATAIIKKFVMGERERAITLALVLGVTDGIDNDLLAAYSASGAMHVLSVSGLHVGIIYFILMLLLKPLSPYAWSRWMLAVFTLLFLWAYAFVTGLSPSVLLAVMMFSFIAIAQPLGWKTNIYNTLAASAFLLLIYNPYLVMSVGFQLSYIAVIGIVYLQRPLYNVWEPSSWLLDKVWQVTCVSIAAQLATFGLGLLYFHQFPVYFLFSNLIVIPLSTLVLVVGILLLLVSSIPLVGSAVGFCLGWTIKLLNGSVFWVEGLPYSLIEGVYLTTFQSWLLLGVVVFITLLFILKSFKFLLLALGCAIIFSIIQWIHFFQDVRQDQWIVYQIPNHSAIEFISNGQSYFYADSMLAKDASKIHFHINSNRVLAGVGNVQTNPADNAFEKKGDGFHYFVWKGKKIVWIKNNNVELPVNVNADYTILSNRAAYLANELKDINVGQIIIDGSAKLKFGSKPDTINVYSTRIKNAFVKRM